MASLTKRGGIWTARIQINGREHWRSLQTGDRLEAERKAKDLERTLAGTRWVRRDLEEVLERAERDALADEVPLLCETLGNALERLLQRVPVDLRESVGHRLFRRLAGNQEAKIAIADGWNRWMTCFNRPTETKERTLEGYKGIWRRFQEWASKKRLKWMHELDEAAALQYGDHLWAGKVTPRTFTAHTRFLRSVWTILRVPAGLSVSNPWASLKAKVKTAERGRRALSPDEIQRIIAAASGSLRRLLIAGALTGARLGDIASMRWADLDLEIGEWSFIPMKTSRTGKRLALPLLEPLLGELRAEKEGSTGPLVFPEEHSSWKTGELNQQLTAHFQACAITTSETVNEGQQRVRARVLVGFHSLRHAVATLAAKGGVNLAIVQRVLGHASAAITAGYTHADRESSREVLRPLASFLAVNPAVSKVKSDREPPS